MCVCAVYCKYAPTSWLCAVEVECECVGLNDGFLDCLPYASGAYLAVLAGLDCYNIASCAFYRVPS